MNNRAYAQRVAACFLGRHASSKAPENHAVFQGPAVSKLSHASQRGWVRPGGALTGCAQGPLKGRIQLTDAERQTLAEIGKKLGKQALAEVANIVKPDTILSWHRKLAADKFDGSEQRKPLGRPRVDKEPEDLVVQMAKDNRRWDYDRLASALAHLGYDISDQTVGNILKRRGLSTAPERKKTTTWKEFIRTHMSACPV